MVASRHRVRRQAWRVSVRSAGEAFATRARLRSQAEELAPAFERAFDACAPHDTVVRIPRLDLKLRIGSLDELAQALEQALDEALERGSPPPGAAASTAAADGLRALVAYLESGTLPWHATHGEVAIVFGALRDTAMRELQAVVHAAPATPAAFERTLHYYLRLLQLLPKERWTDAAARLGPGASVLPAAGEAVPGRNDGTAAAPRQPDRSSFVTVIEAAASSQAPGGEQTRFVFAALALAALRRNERPAEATLEALLRSLDVAAAEPVRGELKRFFPAPPPDPHMSSAEVEASPEPALSAPLALQDRAAAQPFALMASHAGLVLLHPFLPRLFEACELYRERRIVSLPRAAALLHWLATGRHEALELELGTVKALLGLHPEAPLPLGPGLVGARERGEGEALLRAAIEHWKALKNTSVDALRVAFLQRRGALPEEEAGWRLQPERESYDLLLGHLPWSFATVRLPWMTRPLYTDWPTH